MFESYDSYVPPFYKGKALVPTQGTFKVVAMPNILLEGEKINPSNLAYTWIKDGSVVSSASGWGKNYFIFQNSYLDKGNVIEVRVSDIMGGINASKRMNLKTANPKILFYRNDPTFGIMTEKSLNNGFSVNKDGDTIIAEPYFFSPKDLGSSNLTFDWFLSGEKIKTLDIKNRLSIKPEGESGNGVIKVMINNIGTLFQSVEKQINVSF